MSGVNNNFHERQQPSGRREFKNSIYNEDFIDSAEYSAEDTEGRPSPYEGGVFGQGSSLEEEWRGSLETAEKAQAVSRLPKTYEKAADESKPLPSKFGKITPKDAANGIVLAEILGPPKGRSYFSNRKK